MNLRPTIHCPCNGAHVREVFSYDAPPEGETRFDLKDVLYKRAYDRCGLCEHFFARHAMDLTALYSTEYVDATYGGVEGMRLRLETLQALPPDRSDNAGRVSRILEYAQNVLQVSSDPPSILDVGAGIGVFPAAIKEAGWQVTAVEPDVRTARHLREAVGVNAIAGTLYELDSERVGRFDVVTFNKVLEHVEDPVALLRKGAEFVETDGFLYAELPDVAAAADGSGREEFFIEHHHVFSPQSFAALADRAGLSLATIERLREPSGKWTMRAFISKAVR